MKDRIKPYYFEIAYTIRNEFVRRFEEDKHFNLKQMLSSDSSKLVNYNIAVQDNGRSEEESKAFQEKFLRDMPDGLQDDEKKDWARDWFRTTLENMHEKAFDEAGITNDSPDEFGDSMTVWIKYVNNPFDFYPSHLYEKMSIDGFEFMSNLSQYVFDIDILNEKIEPKTEQSYSDHSSKIQSIKTEDLAFLKDGKGYVVPTFNRRFSYRGLKSEYENLKNDTKDNLPHTAILSIGNYRDLLEKQIMRQLTVTNDLNEMLFDSLNLFYTEVESNFLEVLKRMTSTEKSSLEPLFDLHNILLIATNIHESFFSNRCSEYEMKMHKNNILKIPYASKKGRNLFIEKMETIFNKKKPILDVSARLIQKIRICESLLEDLLMGKPFKRFEEFREIIKCLQPPESNNYGFLSQHIDWRKKTFAEQVEQQPSDNQAAEETSKLFAIKFNPKKISSNHVKYLCKYKK